MGLLEFLIVVNNIDVISNFIVNEGFWIEDIDGFVIFLLIYEEVFVM